MRGWVMKETYGVACLYDEVVEVIEGDVVHEVVLSSPYPFTTERIEAWRNGNTYGIVAKVRNTRSKS